jgi:tetratricopeptide (TPR) repeat protein
MTVDTPEIIRHRYQILEPVGSGGMGTVYRAHDMLFGEDVALKRVRPGEDSMMAAQNANYDARMIIAQEFKTLAGLRHPNIISVRDYGFDEDGQPFYTMDLLLQPQTILEAGQGRSTHIQVSYLMQVLQALAYLHRRRVIHRDLKPANVLVVNDHVKVLDFGLSIVEQTTASQSSQGIAGTLAYMAPELLLEGEATESSDLYALGVIAYELMAGHHPYNTGNVARLIWQLRNDYPDLTQIDAEFPMVNFINQLLQRSPNERFQQAVDAMVALNRASGAELPIETEATRESYLQSAKLVGRASEVEQLLTALDAAKDGQGSAWLVGGESGVGKSRLIDEIRTQAMVRGALVLRGQAISEAGGVYEVWQAVLQWLQLLKTEDHPTLDALMPGGTGQQLNASIDYARTIQDRLLKLLLETLDKIEEPVLITLEDLHWAGEVSLSLLEKLSERLAERRVLVIGSYRDDEAPRVAERLSQLNSIKLERLSEEDLARLSEDMLGEPGTMPNVLDLLKTETEGNVYFLIEVVRALAEVAGGLDRIGLATLPESVFAGGIQQIIRRRISQVPMHARDLLYTAAAYGRHLNIDLLRRVAPDADIDQWLLVVSEAAVIDVADETWRFTHDRLREEVLNHIPEVARVALHQQIAQALESLYQDSVEHLLATAYHWAMSGNTDKEEIYSAHAGELSVRSGAYKDAIKYTGRARELAKNDPNADTRRKRETRYCQTLATAHLGLGNYSMAEALYRENLERGKQGGDEATVAMALSNIGLVTIATERYEEAKAYFEDSLRRYRDLEDSNGTMQALSRLGDIEYELGNPARAQELYQESLRLAREFGKGWGSPGLTNVRRKQRSAIEEQAYRQQRKRLLDDLSAARRSADKLKMTQAMEKLGVAELNLSNIKEARRLLALAAASYRTLGHADGLVRTSNQLGTLLLEAELYPEAEQTFQQALGVATRLVDSALAGRSLVGLASAKMMLGDPETALLVLAYLLHDPVVRSSAIDAAELLVFQLEKHLDDERATTIWRRGKTITLAALVMELTGQPASPPDGKPGLTDS